MEQQNAFEFAFNTIKKLVDDFEKGKLHFLDPSYSESQARLDFIDKFFVALGWDVGHVTDKNPYEQEVKVELNVNVQGRKKRADYAFYLKPNFRDVVFYVEAKKPSVQIANADDYFQTIRYGYNSHTPLAILTDFEQLHILDCRYSPSIETSLDRYVSRYTYKDYINKEKFSEIYYLFSREAVGDGSIYKRAAELPKARGGAVQLGLFKGAYKPIDEHLLDDLDGYRDKLAHAFKNGNSDLDHWDLTEIVQRVIDRIVFIRFLEDKLIEPEEILSNLGTKSDSVWKDFVSACRRLDKIYNGIIFKNHSILDEPGFKFNENVFADICEQLSNKNTPYDFNAIPIHILGSIYERFLGKVITTTDKRAKVEDKPEVIKAGGVFYTPGYIVEYIVANTIGKLIEGKDPNEIASMRFADIACGSGSFLIGAYDYLLNYHSKWYNNNRDYSNSTDCVERDGGLVLSLQKKREILQNNIYGVDIDQQAVEVAQLSLYLKLLENETLGSTAIDRKNVKRETVLPSLGKNIQCGNSLIGTDYEFTEGTQQDIFEQKEYVKTVNVFDWKSGFPSVFKNGGFDAVVGNPPYIRSQFIEDAHKQYYAKKFKAASYQPDTFAFFLEQGIKLLNGSGLLGFIIPNGILTNTYYSRLREYLLRGTAIEIIVDLKSNVFANASVDTSIFVISHKINGSTVIRVEWA